MPLSGFGINNLPHFILGEVALFPFRDFWEDQVPIPPAVLSENLLKHPDNVADGLRSEVRAVQVRNELLRSAFIHFINREIAKFGLQILINMATHCFLTRQFE